MDAKHVGQQALAERWGIHPRTLEGWRARGVGPAFLKLCGRVVYRLSDIMEYENRCLRNSTSTSVNTEHGGVHV